MLVLLTIIWGLTFPAIKAALASVTPWQFLAFRFMIGAIIFFPIMALNSTRRRVSYRQALSKVWLVGGGLGVLLLLGFALQAIGMKYTTASRSGFFTGLLTLMVPIFATIFKTSKASLMVWLAIPVALSGIYFLADPNLGGINYGDWLTIGCAIVFALQMVALEATSNHYPQSGNREIDDTSTDALTFAQLFMVGVGCSLIAAMEGKPVNIAPVGWWGIAYTALFGSLIAVWLQTKFQPKVPAGYAGMIFTLEPLWAAFFGWLLLGDMWTERGLIGAGCILIAMVISSIRIGNVS